MKKSFLFFVIFCFGVYNYASSQITTRKSAPEQTNNHPIVFDSIHDYPQSAPETWVGQTLYVKPCSNKYKRYGIPCFKKIKKKKNGDIEIKGTYGKVNKKDYPETTESSDLEGKYLIVKRYIQSCSGDYWKDGYLLLQNKNDSTDCFVWQYHKYYPVHTGFNEFYNPFIALSHYNYLKQKYIGQTLIVSPHIISKKDIENGQVIKPHEMPCEWTCTDVSYVEATFGLELALIIKQGEITSFFYEEKLWLDSTYCYNGMIVRGWPEEKITASDFINEMLVTDVPYTKKSTYVYFKRDWDILISKYGKESMRRTLVGTPYVGMPTHLLFLSEGSPKKTNKASYGNQYIYDDVRYYDEKGVVTGWN